MTSELVGRRRPSWRGAAWLLAALVAACATPGVQATGKVPVRLAAAGSGDEMPALRMTPFGDYLAGWHAQYQHDYGAAARFFGSALASDPGDFELMNRTFLFDLSEGEIAKATELAKRIHAVDSASPLANLVLTLAQLKAGDLAGAAKLADELPRDGIHRFITPLAVAWIKAGEGETDAALAALGSLDDVKGFAPLVDFHRGLIDEYAGREADAEAALGKLVDPGKRANWRSTEALAQLYQRAGKTQKARALYRKFLAENPESDLAGAALAQLAAGKAPPPRIAGPADGMAEALFDIAGLLNQSETADLSLIYARLALDLKPDFPVAHLLVADIDEAQHRLEAALAEYRTIPHASPYAFSTRLREASDLEAMGKTDDAKKTLDALAAERPDRTEALVQLGDLLRAKNKFAEAVTIYDQAIARLGKKVEKRDWTLFYSRGIALERAGQWPRAEADFQHALALEPDEPLVLNYLGYSWVERGTHLDEALKMIEKAVQLRPDDGYIVDSLGWALYRLGNFAKATENLERAVELRPDDPTINDHLGDAYWQTGRTIEARSQWRRALQFGPEPADAKTIEAKLDRGLAKPNPGPATAQGG